MNKFGIEVAELLETANLLLRGRQWLVRNGLDVFCPNENFTRRHSIAKIFHLMKSEEALIKA
jgi:hypothetical protein